MRLSKERALQRSADVLSQRVRGETVLLDLASDQYFGLDEVGSRIWQLVGQGQSCAMIVDALLEEYAVDRERLERDVLACVGDLVAAGLVTPAAVSEEVETGGGKR